MTTATPRRPPIRLALIALVAMGLFVAWGAIQFQAWLSRRNQPPRTRDVTFDVCVLDDDSGQPVGGAQVELDVVTGNIDHGGAFLRARTDSDGRAHLTHAFGANTVRDHEGRVRGRVTFANGAPLTAEPYFLVLKAPGYRAWSLGLNDAYPRGIDYEDSTPQVLEIRLKPAPRPAETAPP